MRPDSPMPSEEWGRWWGGQLHYDDVAPQYVKERQGETLFRCIDGVFSFLCGCWIVIAGAYLLGTVVIALIF